MLLFGGLTGSYLVVGVSYDSVQLLLDSLFHCPDTVHVGVDLVLCEPVEEDLSIDGNYQIPIRPGNHGDGYVGPVSPPELIHQPRGERVVLSRNAVSYLYMYLAPGTCHRSPPLSAPRLHTYIVIVCAGEAIPHPNGPDISLAPMSGRVKECMHNQQERLWSSGRSGLKTRLGALQ